MKPTLIINIHLDKSDHLGGVGVIRLNTPSLRLQSYPCALVRTLIPPPQVNSFARRT